MIREWEETLSRFRPAMADDVKPQAASDPSPLKVEGRWRLWWLVFCVGGGIAGSTIPWGNPDKFHGTGWPIAVVMWDKPPGSDHFLDYPNPYGGLLNVLVLMIAGLILRGVFLLIKKIFRREPKGGGHE